MSEKQCDKHRALIEYVAALRAQGDRSPGLSSSPFSAESWEMIEDALRAFTPSHAREIGVAFACPGGTFEIRPYGGEGDTISVCTACNKPAGDHRASAPSTTPRTLVPRPGGADDGSNDWEPSAEIVAAVKRVSDKVMDASLAECDLFDLAYIAYTASAIAQWIPVSERLPNDLKATLVADEYGRVVAAEWDWNPVDGKRTCRWPCVTHWMTFPKSPIHRPDGGKQT